MSPILSLPVRRRPLVVAYGTRELPELQRQSSDYWAAWSRAGDAGGKLLPLDHHHLSILDELAQPGGALARAAEELARSAR